MQSNYGSFETLHVPMGTPRDARQLTTTSRAAQGHMASMITQAIHSMKESLLAPLVCSQ